MLDLISSLVFDFYCLLYVSFLQFLKLRAEFSIQQRDTGRKTFGLKEIKLSNAYIAALDIDKKTDDAKNLLEWKAISVKNVG